MKKIDEKIVESCVNCPHSYYGSRPGLSCGHPKFHSVGGRKIEEQRFPNWCPLKELKK